MIRSLEAIKKKVTTNENFSIYLGVALLGGFTGILSTQLSLVGGLLLVVSMVGLIVFFLEPPAALFFLAFSTISSLEIPVGMLGSKLVTFQYDIPVLIFLWGILFLGSVQDIKKLTVKFKVTFFDRLLFGFVIVALFSLLVSLFYLPIQDVLVGFLYLVQWFLYLSIPFLILNFINSRPQVLKFLLLALLISGILTSAYFGLLYLTNNVPKLARDNIGYQGKVIPRLKGFWAQGSNVTGMYLVLHASLALGLSLTSKSKKMRLFLGGFVIFCGVLTLFTYSRSAYLGLIFGLGTPIYLRRRKLFYILLVIVLVSSPFILPETVIHRVTQDTFQYREVPALGIHIPLGSATKRINSWVKLFPLIFRRPFVGSGFNLTFANTMQIYDKGFIADNTYISLLVNVGFIGLSIFLLMMRTILYKTANVLKQTEDWVFNGLALGLMGGLFAFLVWAFWSDVYARWRVLGPLFMYVGLIMAVPTHIENAQKDAEV